MNTNLPWLKVVSVYVKHLNWAVLKTCNDGCQKLVVILLVEKNIWLDQWFSTWWWYTWNFQWSTGLLSRRLNMSFSSLSYVPYSFDQLSVTCQHSEVVHRIFLKTARGPTKVENHWARFMRLWTMHTTTLLTSDVRFVRLMAILLS